MPHGTSEIISEGEGDRNWDSTSFNMDIVTELRRFLDEHISMRPEDPFFSYIALGNVHTPHTPPDKYFETDVAGVNPTFFLDMLYEMDLAVGDMIKALHDRDLLEDTLIIFASDNGGLSEDQHRSERYGHRTNGPLFSSKSSIYEGGHRVPMIMRWDGVFPAGETRSHLIGLNDLFATLADLTDVEVPDSVMDSTSFADYIGSNDESGLREFLATWKISENDITAIAVRWNNFKYIQQAAPGSRTGVHESLFDLSDDISETNNLIQETQYEEMVSRMRAYLETLEGPEIEVQ